MQRWVTCLALLLATACRHDPAPVAPQSAGGVTPAVTATPSREPCATQRHVQRCTADGPLGPWDAVVGDRQATQLTIGFTGGCGFSSPIDGADPTSPYRAGVKETDTQVTVFIYGYRPYSNLCASQDEILVRLSHPLGRRVLRDGYDGTKH